MKKTLLSIFALAMLMIASTVGNAQTTYNMVTSEAELEAGAQYLLVGYDDAGAAYVMSYQKSNNRHAVPVNVIDNVITTIVASDPNDQNNAHEVTLGGTPGAWTLYDPLKNGYLCAPGGGNYLKTQTTLDDKGKWTISQSVTDLGFVPVSNGGVEQCIMRFNINNSNPTGTPLFGCYKESSSVVAAVYFFKASGAANPDPEPENYPTGFDVDPNGADVLLFWEDPEPTPVGYLPRAYLVVGSCGDIPGATGEINVPVDGVPVANDMEASDGRLACNVMYGVQECVFENLPGNTTWNFAIFPYNNSGSAIDYKTDGNYPTVTYTTDEYEVVFDGNFDDGTLGEFNPYNVMGDATWSAAEHSSNYYAYINGYTSGVGAQANEDWLITPAIHRIFPEVTLSFRSAMNFSGDALRVMISKDYDGHSNPNSKAVWEDVTDMFDWSSGSYFWTESGDGNITNFVDSEFYVAFVYTSTDAAAAAWEIDNVTITCTDPTGIGEQVVKLLTVAPNPANDQIHFMLDESAQVAVYDVNGRMVSQNQMGVGENTINVSQLKNGVYFLNIRYNDGKMDVARFVKF